MWVNKLVKARGVNLAPSIGYTPAGVFVVRCSVVLFLFLLVFLGLSLTAPTVFLSVVGTTSTDSRGLRECKSAPSALVLSVSNHTRFALYACPPTLSLYTSPLLFTEERAPYTPRNIERRAIPSAGRLRAYFRSVFPGEERNAPPRLTPPHSPILQRPNDSTNVPPLPRPVWRYIHAPEVGSTRVYIYKEREPPLHPAERSSSATPPGSGEVSCQSLVQS